jgi:hypothetical protein
VIGLAGCPRPSSISDLPTWTSAAGTDHPHHLAGSRLTWVGPVASRAAAKEGYAAYYVRASVIVGGISLVISIATGGISLLFGGATIFAGYQVCR